MNGRVLDRPSIKSDYITITEYFFLRLNINFYRIKIIGGKFIKAQQTDTTPKKMTSLRPTPTFVAKKEQLCEDEPFRFGNVIFVRPSIPVAEDSGCETDEEDHEARIQSSWHHRARLGDENRILYTDHKDTDFSALIAREDEPSTDSVVF